MNPAPDVHQARWIINQQLVRGINLFECMFFSSSSENRRGVRGYMGDPLFPALMSYANRAGYLLQQGKPTAQIAVYFPTTSLWMGHNESEKSTFDIAQQLLESQHDFDFIDEHSLTSFTVTKQGAIVNKSGQEYNTIIIPSINVLSKAALNRLKEFAAKGRKVIFTGERPSLITDKNFLKADGIATFEWASQKEISELSALALLPTDVKLDQPSTSIKYLHRKLKDADMYFFFNESDQPVSRNVTLYGKGTVQEVERTRWKH
jgi:hypothetical protein